MTMLGHVRGGADKQRRTDSLAAAPPTKLTVPISSSHASRSAGHTSISAFGRNGHLTTSSKGTAVAIDHPSHSKKNNTGYDFKSDKRKDIGIQQEQQQRTHQDEVRHPRRHSNSNGRPENNSSSGSSTIISGADANVGRRDIAFFRAGMKLIQQAYEEKYQSLIEEVNTWKWISEEQSAQMTAMAAELARIEDKNAALQKEMAQLEVFRKAIVSMVDQHSGVSLAQLERSILETIEADTGVGMDAVADADTSSFILDGGNESPQILPQHQRSVRDEFSMREQKPTTAKESPQITLSRPRATTEVTTKKSDSISHVPDTKGRHQSGSTALSPLGANGTRGGGQVLSDSSPNEQTKMQKSISTDSLRYKRNTISTTSRSIYPNTTTTTGNGSKRPSSTTSPLISRSRSGTASSRAVPASSSFSSNSTPSTSPRQPTTNVNSTSIITRATRQQQQQQKEYSVGVRNSMSQMATFSGIASTAPHFDAADRRQASSDSTIAGQISDQGSTSKRGQRPSSTAFSSLSSLSPAAMELIKQQERQQRYEEEASSLQKSPSNHLHQQQDILLANEEEGRRRSVIYSQSRLSTKDRAAPTHYPSGYESSTRHQNDMTRRRQSATSGERAGIYSGSGSSNHPAQQSSGGVDANAFTLLYKEIRDSMDSQSFGMFARVVTAFNEGEKTTDETLQEVSKIVQDRALNQRFRDLIHKAIAEKESQFENGDVNESMGGDVTLEIDHSLLLEDENRIEEVEEELEEEERNGHIGERNGSNGRLFHDEQHVSRISSGLMRDEELNTHASKNDITNIEDLHQSRLNIDGSPLLAADRKGNKDLDPSTSDEWSDPLGH
ncbi:hypothetical protein FBU30_000395 [Linnemannia zychae]|nr:hypothetical protein FBU30_000395 [Linnemannia zychae]